jgi:hypothetical protein
MTSDKSILEQIQGDLGRIPQEGDVASKETPT